MKTLSKLFLLLALVVAGKVAKESEATAFAAATTKPVPSADSVLLANQTYPKPQATALRKQAQPDKPTFWIF